MEAVCHFSPEEIATLVLVLRGAGYNECVAVATELLDPAPACFQTFPGISAYAAAKGALVQLTRTLALEAIEHGVRVNAVGSGDIVTNLLNSFREDGRDFLAKHGKNAPIKRAGTPEEIAEVVAFLASDKSSFMVGAIVMADGGMSIAIPAQ